MSFFLLQFLVNVLTPASDRALAPLEVRPAVRKVGVSGGRPVLVDPAAATRLSGDNPSLKKAELTLKSGEREDAEEDKGRPVEEEKTKPVIESQLTTVNLATPRQRLKSTSNSTQQVSWNDKLNKIQL